RTIDRGQRALERHDPGVRAAPRRRPSGGRVTEVIETIPALRTRRETAGSVAIVPTMRAPHDGHLALVRRAAELADTVIVSIFVNPLQFGAGEDLDRYPRDLDSDLEKLPDDVVVFAPSVAELYPDGASETLVTAGEAGTLFE